MHISEIIYLPNCELFEMHVSFSSFGVPFLLSLDEKLLHIVLMLERVDSAVKIRLF